MVQVGIIYINMEKKYKIFFGILSILLLSILATATTTITGTGITTTNINSTQVYYGSGYNGFGNYSGIRALVSTATVTRTVCDSGCDYTLINTALKQAEFFRFHQYTIAVQSPYTAKESVFIGPTFVASDMAANDIGTGALRLKGNCSNINEIEINSVHILSSKGHLNPLVECMKVTGSDPQTDENTSIAVIGTDDAIIQLINLSGSTAELGILSYSSGTSVAQIDLGSSLEYGFMTKHNGRFHFEPCTTTCFSNPVSSDYNVIGAVNQYVYINNGGIDYGFNINGATAGTSIAGPFRGQITDATNGIIYGVNTTTRKFIVQNTDSGSEYLQLQRNSWDGESFKMYVDDTYTFLETTQDEAAGLAGSMRFTLDGDADPRYEFYIGASFPLFMNVSHTDFNTEVDLNNNDLLNVAELEVNGVSVEVGQVLCVKSDGNIGTCTTDMNATGGGCGCS